MEKLRAFVAISPPAGWIQPLARFQDELKRVVRSNNIRWVDPGQIHITLRFFGWVESGDLERIIAELRAIQRPAFELRLGSLGCFPNERRPRVLWLGLEGDLAALNSLQAAVTLGTAGFGEPPEDRPFTGHLTLARIKEVSKAEKDALQAVLQRRMQLEIPWPVDSFELKRSHLSPAGARYETLATLSLG